MEHVGKKVIFAVAQEPFEVAAESGSSNNFATVVPLISLSGEALQKQDFPGVGLVFWMVWPQNLRFADPGRLVSGRLENAVRRDKHHYQLVPETAEIVPPSELIEILDCEGAPIRVARDLVNSDDLINIDHPPTPLVLVRWNSELYGPFRAEALNTTGGTWSVSLRSPRPDQTVFKIPAAELNNVNTFAPHHHRISAQVSYGSREPVQNSPECNYEVIMGAGFKRLPSMGFELVSVESDREMLLRYARRFTSRKTVQQLRDLLSTVEPDLEQTGDSVQIEREVFESIRRRSTDVLDELHILSQSLVSSGLLDQQIQSAVEQRAEAYVSQQSAKLSSEIASNINARKIELEHLQRQKDSLTDEVEGKQRHAEEEIEKKKIELERWRTEAENTLAEAKREVDTQRSRVATLLENVVRRYEISSTTVMEDFLTLLPLMDALKLMAPQSRGTMTLHEDPTPRNAQEEFAYPQFVTAPRGGATPQVSEGDFFSRFVKHVEQSGYNGYRRLDLVAFHLSVKCGDITILGGMSGTGKSTLPLLYAEALAGQSAIKERYLQIGVSPNWVSMQDLLGGINSLERTFEPSESGLYRQLLIAQEESRRHQQETGIYVATLDEMNLAHVEHYFSGFLQALEGSREISVFDASSVDSSSTFALHGSIRVPLSIRFVGTVNFDETTRQLSRRLLDRANLIRLRPGDQNTYFAAQGDARPTVDGPTITLRHFRDWRRSDVLPKDVAVIWDKVQQHLVKLGVPATPRRRRGMEAFIASAGELISPLQAFDLQMAQRMIPQVRGTYRSEVQMTLDDLQLTLSQNAYGFPETLASIDDLRRNEDGGLGMISTS